ncbi:MAG: 5-(carboxyamino)imidazole ribonucleotide mutase [Synergistaceae bacterium]|nr:5-(carboxyamino)imidazole ribonucleotide mutase [Synergistaceae bacterium]
MTPPLTGVVLGSDSDWPVVEPGYRVLEEFGVGVEVVVASAHRTPDDVRDFARGAAARGIEVIIAAAGGAAHLPGVVAAHTTLPVIGLPVGDSRPQGGGTLGGLDAALSMLQMPAGVPVGVMAINGGKNAALYAVSILALKDAELAKKLRLYREAQADAVRSKSKALVSKINGGHETPGDEHRNV